MEELGLETFADNNTIHTSHKEPGVLECSTKIYKAVVPYAYGDDKLQQTKQVEFIKVDDEIAAEEGDDDKGLTISSSATTPASPVRKLRIRFSGFSTEQWIALAIMCYYYLSSCTSQGMLATFFSTEILRRGGDQFYVGVIFGIYPISNCVLCPLFTYLLKQVSCRTMLIGGFAVLSLSSLTLSQLGRVTSTETFVISCIILRVVQSIGSASTQIAALFLLSRMWRDDFTFAFGIAETFAGAGMLIGPILGGLVYQTGGFAWPFYGSCISEAIGALLCFCTLRPSSNQITTGNFLQLLRIPTVAATALFVCVICAACDVLGAELQVHMEVLNSTPVIIGAMFVIYGSSYLLAVATVGFFAQSHLAKREGMIGAGLLVAISYLILGPSPIFSPLGWTGPSVTSVSIAMVMLGFGSGVAYVPVYSDISRTAISHGFEDNDTTDSLVGALFNSSCFLGEFLGPILGGCMMERVGDFQIVSSLFSVIIALMVILTAICYRVWSKEENGRIMNQQYGGIGGRENEEEETHDG